MMWDISEKFELDFGLVTRIFHLDQTKIRTYVIEPHDCDAEVTKPEFELDKEGRRTSDSILRTPSPTNISTFA